MNRRRFLGYSAALVCGSALTYTVKTPAVLKLLPNLGDPPVKKSIFSLGTVVEITIFDIAEKDVLPHIQSAFNEVREIDRLMSVYNYESDISRVNRNAGKTAVTVDPRTAAVLSAALETSVNSAGAFDVTVLPLLKAMGLRGNNNANAQLEHLNELCSFVDYTLADIDPGKNRVGLRSENAGIDLGGIAKGYAVDRAVDVLANHGIARAIVNAGGDIYALGSDEDGSGFKIGVQHPFKPDEIAAVISLKNSAAATSGNYEKYALINEKKVGHIIDLQRGQSTVAASQDRPVSVTVTAADTMSADAASTAFFADNKSNEESSIITGTMGLLTIDENMEINKFGTVSAAAPK